MFNKSVFRNVQIKQYGDKTMMLKGAATPANQCFGVAASHTHIAAVYGGGNSVVVLPMDHTEYKRDDSPPLIGAHSSGIMDIKFSPFNSTLLATGADDGVVKLWDLPKGGLSAPTSEAKTKIDVGAPVRHFEFHPGADGVLAVGTKQGLNVLDLETGESKFSFAVEGSSSETMTVSWSPNGDRLAAIGKNSALHMFDPRQAPADQMATFTPVDSKKPQRILFVKDQVVVIAQNNVQKPYVALYNPSDLSKHIAKLDLPMSPGVMMTFYDPDTDLLFVVGRSGGILVAFDLSVKGKLEMCSNMVTKNDVKGGCLIPKSAIDTSKNEIQRFMSLTNNSLEQYGLHILRKQAGFAPELYPDTDDCASVLSAADYFGGADGVAGKVPIRTMISNANTKCGVVEKETPAEEPKAAEVAKPSALMTSSASTSGKFSASPSNKNSLASPTAASPMNKVSYKMTDERAKIDKALAGSKFRHIDTKEALQQNTMYYKQVPHLGSVYMSKNIKCNSEFYALPTTYGKGSTIEIHNLKAMGRGKDKPFVVTGHSVPITCFDLCRTNNNLLVTADGNGVIKVWDIPEGGLKQDLKECRHEMAAKGRVSVCQLSESVEGLLMTASSSPDGHTVQVWDALTGVEACCLEGFHEDAVMDIQLDPYGSLMATVSKDGFVRVLDVRQKDMVAEFKAVETLRDTHVLWVNRDLLLVMGTAKGSRRSLSLWNIRTQELVIKKSHDMNAATYLPHFDRETGILFTANNGGTNVQIWEITTEAPYIELLRTYQSPTMFQGSCFFPKLHGIDVKNVRLAKSLKLFEDKVIPCTWTVPRKRLDYFQDDIFPENWDGKPLCTSTEWLGGEYPNGGDLNYISVCPEGMTALSEAPPEELTERQKRYEAHITAIAAPKTKGTLGHESAEEVAAYFTEKAKELPTTNRFDAAYDASAADVDDDEW